VNVEDRGCRNPASVESRVFEIHPRKNPQTKMPEDSECELSAEELNLCTVIARLEA
jgi:hypothetical protein